MSEAVSIVDKRKAGDVMDALDSKLSDINSLLDIMTTCDKDQCNVNDAAYAIQRLVEDAIALSRELYHAPDGGTS